VLSSQLLETYPSLRMAGAIVPRKSEFDLNRFTSLHDLGRNAFYRLFTGLRAAGEANVWFPQYHCGVEVQAAIDAGLQVSFYAIRPDLSVDAEELIRTVGANRGLIVIVHYFGFPQPELSFIAEECRSRHWILIEDCAQALFSRDGERPLGFEAPFSIFSLKKTLPLIDGGALQINTKHIDSSLLRFLPEPSDKDPGLVFYAEAAKAQIATRWPNLTGIARWISGRKAIDPEELRPCGATPIDRRRRAMSKLSQNIAAVSNPIEIIRLRRRNYKLLEERFQRISGFCSIFDGLGPGICPLSLPIRVSNRAEFLRRLHQLKIRPFVFGAHAHATLSGELREGAAWMRDEIVTLPVHQQLSTDQLDRLANSIAPLLTRHLPPLSRGFLAPAVAGNART
jgi:perosamine synthetase